MSSKTEVCVIVARKQKKEVSLYSQVKIDLFTVVEETDTSFRKLECNATSEKQGKHLVAIDSTVVCDFADRHQKVNQKDKKRLNSLLSSE